MDKPVQTKLSWYRSDLESRCGLPAGLGTDINNVFAGLLALLGTGIIYGIAFAIPNNFLSLMLTARGPTQHAAVFLGCWCIAILLLKRNKLRVQRKSLKIALVPPDQHDFVLSSTTADQLTARLHNLVEDPEKFIVFNRILTAISNLKNLGRVSDVDDILHSAAERDESALETSYSLINGFLWAIPVLGFIGTVLGLSQSIATFSNMLDQQTEVSGIVSSLKEITSGLSTAFETTLLALVIALFIQLWMTVQKAAEQRFLDDCTEYCLKQVISRIKILPFEQSREI
jgi:biopolymer transport protein ExbB/TolQ